MRKRQGNEQAQEPSNTEVTVTRRGFLRVLMWGSLVLALVESGLAGLLMSWPRRTSSFGGKIVAGPVESFPPGSVTKVASGRFYVVHLPEGLLALHWRCTHLGCTVPWVESEQRFHCPCHGSVFDTRGLNISGPAPRPLDYMKLTISDGQVVVDTGVIQQRSTHELGHATPV